MPIIWDGLDGLLDYQYPNFWLVKHVEIPEDGRFMVGGSFWGELDILSLVPGAQLRLWWFRSKKWECVIILGTLFRKLYQPKRLRTSQVHNCGNIIKGNLLDLLVMFTKKNQHLIPSHEFHIFFPPFHRSRPSPGHSWTSRPSATDTRGVPGSFAAPWASTKLRSLLRYRLGRWLL